MARGPSCISLVKSADQARPNNAGGEIHPLLAQKPPKVGRAGTEHCGTRSTVLPLLPVNGENVTRTFSNFVFF